MRFLKHFIKIIVCAGVIFTCIIPTDVSAAVTTVPNLSMFKRIGVVGDSFASGEIVVDGKLQDIYPISWPQVMGQRYGVCVNNYTKGGLYTGSWLSDAMGSPRMKKSLPDDLYILALGLNDSNAAIPFLGLTYLGSMNDIVGKSGSRQYANSFYGNYARIIEQIKSHAPNAKIVLVYINLPNEVTQRYNQAISELAMHYGLPVINQIDDDFFSSEAYWNMEMGHPTQNAYSGMADAYARLITECVMKYPAYFAN